MLGQTVVCGAPNLAVVLVAAAGASDDGDPRVRVRRPGHHRAVDHDPGAAAAQPADRELDRADGARPRRHSQLRASHRRHILRARLGVPVGVLWAAHRSRGAEGAVDGGHRQPRCVPVALRACVPQPSSAHARAHVHVRHGVASSHGVCARMAAPSPTEYDFPGQPFDPSGCIPSVIPAPAPRTCTGSHSTMFFVVVLGAS